MATSPRILHLGNVAQNGYLNAKFQRRLGMAADVACDDRDAIAQPEWEEARVPPHIGVLDVWPHDLHVDGWRRPEWVLRSRRVRRGRRLAYAAHLRLSGRRLVALEERLRRGFEPLRGIVPGELTRADVLEAVRLVWVEQQTVGPVRQLLSRYDLVQAYGGNAQLPFIVGRLPYVAFEHGTLRELPWEDSSRGRLTALGFRQAAVTVVTNADVIDSARRLGLPDVVFVPHPIDETKYRPGPSSTADRLRAEGVRFVLLAPARQDWREKGNDILLRGAAPLLRRQPDAVLLAADWGPDVTRSKSLAHELGIAGRVRWYPPVPKLELLDLYRAADVVLDQFALGTFGATAPEALSCGKPVVMAYDSRLHEWCFPDQPPIVDAATSDQLETVLLRLADTPSERARLGECGRKWVERHHGWRLVTERQREIYERVVEHAGSHRR